MNNKVIIIEGPDCAGKTTLGTILKEAFNGELHHLTYCPEATTHIAQFETYKNLIDGIISGKSPDNKPLILDRYFISNNVYADVAQGGDNMLSEKFILEMQNAIVNNPNVDIIFALPYDKEMYLNKFAQGINSRRELYPNVELMKKVYDGFLKEYEKLSSFANNVYRFDMFKAQV